MIDGMFQPEVGDIKRAWQLGRKRSSSAKLQKYIYIACPECEEKRWVSLTYFRMSKNKGMCQRCIGRTRSKSCWAKGGRVNKDGYVKIKLYPEDFFFAMANSSGYVLEHRLVMAKYLNRCLLPWEVVHHKGTKYPMGSKEDKADNRIENLKLLPTSRQHLPDSVAKSRIKQLEKEVNLLKERVTLLEVENVLLRAEKEASYDK